MSNDISNNFGGNKGLQNILWYNTTKEPHMLKKPDLEAQPVSIRLLKGQIEHLRRIARQRAIDDDKDVSYSDLIRTAVDKTYPMGRK